MKHKTKKILFWSIVTLYNLWILWNLVDAIFYLQGLGLANLFIYAGAFIELFFIELPFFAVVYYLLINYSKSKSI